MLLSVLSDFVKIICIFGWLWIDILLYRIKSLLYRVFACVHETGCASGAYAGQLNPAQAPICFEAFFVCGYH